MKAYEIFEKIDEVVVSLYGKAMDYISDSIGYSQGNDLGLAAVGGNGLETEVDTFDPASLNTMFSKGDKKTGKGGGRLHKGRDTVDVPKEGRIIKVNRAKKPKGETLISFVMREAGVNRKQASNAIKNCQ